MKKIAIDLVPIRVGEGGTGSGIWTYARELIHHMDQVELDGLEIVVLVNNGQLPYLSNLRNIRLIHVPTFGKNMVLRLLWVHLFLPLVCLFRRIDVLHKLATETPLFCPAKRVTTVHDFYYEFLLENNSPKTLRVYERLENFYFSLTTLTCFQKSRAVIAVSDSTRQEAIRRYPKTADRIQVIHHGVRGEGIDPLILGVRQVELPNSLAAKSRKESQNKEGPIFEHQSSKNQGLRTDLERGFFNMLCVAKFMEHKGQHLLVAAFDALLDTAPERVGKVRLILRGFHNDKKYYEALCRQVSDSRFAEYIQLVAFNPTEQLGEIYADTDLVVLLSSYEGFGLPVLEAQSRGVPVLCSNLAVLQEVGGEGAAYVEREDVHGVAQAMFRFIKDQDYYETMRVRALENTNRFSWDEAAKQTIRCYERVCS